MYTPQYSNHIQTFLKLGRITLNMHADFFFFLLTFLQWPSTATTYRILYFIPMIHCTTTYQYSTGICYLNKLSINDLLTHDRSGFEKDMKPIPRNNKKTILL